MIIENVLEYLNLDKIKIVDNSKISHINTDLVYL